MRFTRFKTTLAFAIPAVFTVWVWLDRLSSARSAAAAAESSLSLQVLDEQGKPVMARLRLRDGAGQAKLPELLDGARAVPIHPRYPELGIVFPRDGRLRLPEGKSTIQLERGTEYEPVSIELNAASGQNLKHTVTLRRRIHMAEKGWWSGDLHAHRDPADMPALMEAADLNFAPTLTHWNDRPLLESWPAQNIYPDAQGRTYSIHNAEDERAWGAALFLNLRSPIRLYRPRSEYPPPTVTWQEARANGAYIDLEKMIWWQAPVITALSIPDSLGLACNHFMEEGMMDAEAWGRPRDRVKYPGQSGFAQYVLDLYYNYLGAGLRLPASAGSANGVLKNPIGYNRSYVLLDEPYSYDKWLAGQKAGRNFVTNGPMLFLTVEGKPPGSTLPGSIREVSVRLSASASAPLETVELIVDGAVAKSFKPGAKEFTTTVTKLKIRDGGWLAARCFEQNQLTVRFAHTSPVYFGASPARSPQALLFLRSWVETEMERIRWLPAELLTSEQKTEILEICRKARDFYQ
jgi:hypothetical protein